MTLDLPPDTSTPRRLLKRVSLARTVQTMKSKALFQEPMETRYKRIDQTSSVFFNGRQEQLLPPSLKHAIEEKSE
jgi:hypothetical protein